MARNRRLSYITVEKKNEKKLTTTSNCGNSKDTVSLWDLAQTQLC